MTTHDLRALGGVGDGLADDQPAFAAALARCAADGGGTVAVPRGAWLTGSLRLPPRTQLRVDAGATILGHRDPARYPLREQPWEGRMMRIPDSLIWAEDADDVTVSGRGAIDGQGADWWSRLRAGGQESTQRPRLLTFRSCRRLLIAGLRLTNSPAWTVHPWRCSDVRIEGLTIVNPPDAPNTDGIDPESCRDVRIANCLIDVGDDAIVLKSGMSVTGDERFPPCERIVISGCQIVRGHGGVVIGSEMSGGVRDVLVTGCIMRGTDRGIRIKTRRGRGGAVERLTVRDVIMREVGCPIAVYTYYRYNGLRPEDLARVSTREALPVDALTPLIRGLRLSGIDADEVTGPCLGLFYGLPERPIAEVDLEGCRLRHRPEPDPAQDEPAMMVHIAPGAYPTCGLLLADVAGLRLRDVELRPRAGQRVLAERCEMSER